MQKNLKTNSAKRGFTLVELSIVLVIIGLIVGGVLVGQALIAAAKVRSQLTQLDQLDAAMNAFRAKFDCLPGDCAASSGVTYLVGTTSTAAAGNGDGLVTYGAWSATLESAIAYPQMAAQGMVAGNFNAPATTLTSATAAAQIAAGKLGGFVLIGADTTQNYYVLSGYTTTSTETAAAVPADAARTIDAKRDDGAPNTGSTLALTPATTTTTFTVAAMTAATGATNCTAVAGAYQVGSSTATCVLRVRSSG